MSKHTPGPWAVFDAERPGIDAKEFSVLVFGDGEDECGIRGNTREETIANARLIAAAPELLEALIRARKLLIQMHGLWYESVNGDPYDRDDSERETICGQFKALIEKATGEQP